MTDPQPGKAPSEPGPAEEQDGHRAVPTRLREKGTAATKKVQSGVTHAREVASEKAPAVKEALREKRAAATESVHARATHAREFAAEKAPAVKTAAQEHRGLVIGAIATVLGWLLLRRLRGRRRRMREAADTDEARP
jgi:hypothetical protein